MNRFLRKNMKNNNKQQPAKPKTKRSWKATEREQRLESYQSLYNDLVSGGKSPQEALEIVEQLQRQEDNIAEYAAEVNKTEVKSKKEEQKTEYKASDKHIEIRIQIGLNDLLKVVPDFEEMTIVQQREVLYSIGFETKKNNFWREEMLFSNREGRREYGVVIYSSERTDADYVNMRYPGGSRVCSEAAYDLYRQKQDGTWNRTIKELIG